MHSLRHTSKRRLRLVPILVLIAFMAVSFPNNAKATDTPAERVSVIPVNVVLLGFDASQVDRNYLSWSGNSKNLPNTIPASASDGFNTYDTGVVFKPEYTITFAPDSFKQELLTYLNSIAKQAHGPDPWFVKYVKDTTNPDYYVTQTVSVDYVKYDANSVEDWVWNHLAELGIKTDATWTFVVSYLPELPSISFYDAQQFLKTYGSRVPSTEPHYYSTSVSDLDLGYNFPNRDFMKAWGGHHRMWFLDLSAGPVSLISSNAGWDDLPLQVVIGDNNIDLSSDFGKQWLTEYLADYVFDATYSFAARAFIYLPHYAPEYDIDIFVIDDRTSAEKQELAIARTINQSIIASAVRELVPYSQVKVNLNFQNTSQELHDLIGSEYKYTDSWIEGNQFSNPLRYGVIDQRPIYQYILDNPAKFEAAPLRSHTDEGGLGKITIPVFGFVFSGRTYFSSISKWYIEDKDWDTGAELGQALDEGVIIGLNQYEFTAGDYVDPIQAGKGRGFTATIIHEVGHEFGLTHPHDTNSLGDFMVSPMGYLTLDDRYGLIDRDSIQRAHVDEIYLETQRLLNQIQRSPSSPSQVDSVRSKLAEVDSAYAKMNYTVAIQPALEALHMAQQIAAAQNQTQTETQTQTQTTVTSSGFSMSNAQMTYTVAGIVIGMILGLLAAKRRQGSKNSVQGACSSEQT